MLVPYGISGTLGPKAYIGVCRGPVDLGLATISVFALAVPLGRKAFFPHLTSDRTLTTEPKHAKAHVEV